MKYLGRTQLSIGLDDLGYQGRTLAQHWDNRVEPMSHKES